jgi:hypothetical protein
MSGGHFDYQQYHLTDIADSIQSVLDANLEDKPWYDFREDTKDDFKKAIKLLREAAIYAQRIDWLLSGDDGEETFHSRLQEELKEIYK